MTSRGGRRGSRLRGHGGRLQRVGRRGSFEFFELQFVLVEQALRALGALAMNGAGELGDLKPEMRDQRGLVRGAGTAMAMAASA